MKTKEEIIDKVKSLRDNKPEYDGTMECVGKMAQRLGWVNALAWVMGIENECDKE